MAHWLPELPISPPLVPDDDGDADAEDDEAMMLAADDEALDGDGAT